MRISLARLLFLYRLQLLQLRLSYIPDNKTEWPYTAQTSGSLSSETDYPVCFSDVFSKTDTAGITEGQARYEAAGEVGVGTGSSTCPLGLW